MKALITGAKGFLGKNLSATLERLEGIQLLPYDVDTDPALLHAYAGECGFVFHLAGVNRPDDMAQYSENAAFTQRLLEELAGCMSKAPIVYASSIQAAMDTPYGQSKRAAEDLLFAYGKAHSVPVYVYRLTNLFGKWSRPNYNSVVATFCHSVARGLPIAIHDPGARLELTYVDDVVAEFMSAMLGTAREKGPYCSVEPVHEVTVGRVAELIDSFRESREAHSLPDMGDPFTRALYATYLSCLPEDGFSRALTVHADHRGSFAELFRTADRGQFSINIIKPGTVKGNHWHHTKNEKFIAISGWGVIRLRKAGDTRVLEYHVKGEAPEAVDIPPGYAHSILNLGSTDMAVVMWASENYDPLKPDTYYMEV